MQDLFKPVFVTSKKSTLLYYFFFATCLIFVFVLGYFLDKGFNLGSAKTIHQDLFGSGMFWLMVFVLPLAFTLATFKNLKFSASFLALVFLLFFMVQFLLYGIDEAGLIFIAPIFFWTSSFIAAFLVTGVSRVYINSQSESLKFILIMIFLFTIPILALNYTSFF